MDETQFIVAGNFIDGSGDGVRRNVLLTIKDGVITAIGAAADLPHRGAAATDLSHCTILPALVDGSVSLARSPSVDWRGESAPAEGDLAALVARHIRYCHIHGVLGVAAGDDPPAPVTREQQEPAQEGLIEIRAAGHDFLRIAYSPDIEAETTPSLRPVRMLRQRSGQKVVAVANGRQAVAAALAAGCDAIEQGYAMGEENLRKMAAAKVLWIPSLLRAKNALDGSRAGGDVCCRFSQRYAAPGKPLPGAEALWRQTLTAQLAQLRLAREMGVLTAVGTGAGSGGILHGESVVEEMKLFIKAGYPLVETIRCASTNGAGFFGIEKLGPLTVGGPATFLIARGTVPQLPRKLSYLEGIYIAGAPSGEYRKNPTMTAPQDRHNQEHCRLPPAEQNQLPKVRRP